MTEPEELNMGFVASKVDGTTFTLAETDKLTDSLIEWAEANGIGIGGGFMPILESGYNPVETRLRTERDEAVALLRRAREQAIDEMVDAATGDPVFECGLCGSYWPTKGKPIEWHVDDCVVAEIGATERREDAQRQGTD